MMASQAFHFLAPVASFCVWGTPAPQFNSLPESEQGGTAGMESLLVPGIALGGKIPANAKCSKDEETPVLSKIATRGLETKAVTSTMEFEGATIRDI